MYSSSELKKKWYFPKPMYHQISKLSSCIIVRKKKIWSFNFCSSWFNEHLDKCTFHILSQTPDKTPSLSNDSIFFLKHTQEINLKKFV